MKKNRQIYLLLNLNGKRKRYRTITSPSFLQISPSWIPPSVSDAAQLGGLQ
jgi:hypothetical protein